MFEKLITDLKKSLPESLRRKLGEAEDSEDEEVIEESESDDSDAAFSSDEEKKKKRNSMIVKVIIILGIGYFAVDEFVLKGTSEPTIEELLAKAPKRKRPKPVKPAVEAEVETTATVEGDATKNPAAEELTDTSLSTASDTEAPPIENINVLDKSVDTTTTAASEPEVDPVATETTMVESSVDQKLDQLVDNVEQTAPTTPVEEIKIPSHDELPTLSESKEEPPSMASKIVEGITETPPPAYDQVGRGLVYNCKEKHWACLNKPAYVTCNKNMKWNQSKGNSAECVVADVYSSEEDCAKVQKYNVSTSASTAFCQN